MKGHTDKKDKVPLWLLGLVVALVVLFLTALPVRAHGEDGTLVLENVAVGPYELTTQMWPEVVRTGEVYLATMVTADGTPVLNCDVFIQLTPLDHESPVLFAQMRPADVSHHFWHEIELTLADEGRYEVQVVVQDQAGNGGQASFEIEARPSSAWMIALIYGQLTMAPLIGFWLIRQAIRAWLRA